MENLVNIPLWAGIPFVLMLASIAVLPLAAHEFWEHNKNKLIISLVLGIPTAIWLIAGGLIHELEHSILFDYVPFVILLGALFVITGGIFVDGDIEATPRNNVILLAIGGVLASFMGTTGAAMLLIRPLLKINFERENKVHSVLFFIAIVANAGGLLTPIGDPPLFMLYLRGVPFDWFFHLLPEWLFTNLVLLIIYYIYDTLQYHKEPPVLIEFDKANITPLSIKGNLNFLWLIGVVLSVAFINKNMIPELGANKIYEFSREIVILLMVTFSLIFTKKSIHISNKFTWEPIKEVAYLFLGIFITMVPVLLYLEENAAQLGVNHPVQFYYASGFLSSFLDNTPTAVTFYSLGVGLVHKMPQLFEGLPLIAGVPEHLLAAISTASVIFGAMTYIGNGPNFMVKSIAEEQKINMPHFFQYMYKFSLIVLLPIYIIIQLLFI
ncbi:MAG: sodium:proton antiporter [Ignavibacteria bacterium GWF2_33_9]|nr:MAG: sodium:proton antiporter [Ignavibacteria bacterium GWF2_33_9]